MTAATERAEARVRTSAVARHARVSAGGSAEQRGATSDRERLRRRIEASVPWRCGALCEECDGLGEVWGYRVGDREGLCRSCRS